MRIGKLNINFVLRHRFEKKSRLTGIFRKWRIGLWFERNKILGMKSGYNPKEWHKNLRTSYMVGIDFLIFAVWVSWDFGGLHFNIDKDEKAKKRRNYGRD